jgi:hypothetical protein
VLQTFSKFSNPFATASLPPLPPLPSARSTVSEGVGGAAFGAMSLSYGGSTAQISGRKRSGSFDTGGQRSSSNGDFDEDYDDDDEDDEDNEDDYDYSGFASRRARSNSTPNIHYSNSYGNASAGMLQRANTDELSLDFDKLCCV